MQIPRLFLLSSLVVAGFGTTNSAISQDFGGEQVIGTPDGPHNLVADDLDADGDIDVVVSAHYGDRLLWYANDGAPVPSWTEVEIDPLVDGPWNVEVVDMDLDGDLDVLVAAYYDDAVYWYENDGQPIPAWTKRTVASALDGARSARAVDVDGDGDLDVAAASYFDDTISWHENDGLIPPGWTPHVISSTANGADEISVADLDGDGDMDLVATSELGSQLEWFENDGASTAPWTLHAIDTVRAIAVATGDVDGDGVVDVVSAAWNYGGTGPMIWYRSDGGQPPVFTRNDVDSLLGPAHIHLVDLDRDHDLDVLIAAEDGDSVRWFENDGAATPAWTNHLVSAAMDGANSVFAADLDGDLGLDYLSSSWTLDKVNWFRNLDPPDMLLQVDPIHEGGTASFHVSDGPPASWAYVCYSTAGSGPSTLPNGITLDLDAPVKAIRPFQLDAFGAGSMGPIPIPPAASMGLRVWLQAVAIDLLGPQLVTLSQGAGIRVR